MTWSYSAGTATPGFGGLADFPSLRVNQASPYKPTSIPPLYETMPLRVASTPVPRGGAFVDPPLPDAWAFTIEGVLLDITAKVSTGDLQLAIDYLRAHVNAYQGWMVLTLNALGWAATQQMTVRVGGQVSVQDVEVEQKKIPRRGFSIPLLAADPRRYSSATTATTVLSGGSSLANAGTTPTPITVRFNGPQTNPVLNGPGSGNNIAVTTVITSGHWIEVTTVDPTTGQLTAVDDTGTNAFPLLSQQTADYVNPGTSTWTATNSSGAGTTVVTLRDAYG